MSLFRRNRHFPGAAPPLKAASLREIFTAKKNGVASRLKRVREKHGRGLAAAACVVSGMAVAVSGAGAYLCDRAMRLRRRPLNQRQQQAARIVAGASGAVLTEVDLEASDGTALRAWFFRAKQDTGRAVLVLHGQADNRSASLPYAKMFLRNGYNVLCPDMRAHGESGGHVTSYGCREAEDACQWAGWLKTVQSQRAVFALGESMGAAILLQALPLSLDFQAVVAEAPFSSFREISYDRIGQTMGTGDWAGRTLLRPVVESGLAYGRVRYGVDLGSAAPEDALGATRVPILLIHGDADGVIPLRHAERLLDHKSGTVEFWKVPGAGHCRVLFRWPAEFERRICAWFNRQAPVF